MFGRYEKISSQFLLVRKKAQDWAVKEHVLGVLANGHMKECNCILIACSIFLFSFFMDLIAGVLYFPMHTVA